jgi:hypothetical protein
MHRLLATIVGLSSTGSCTQQWQLVLRYAPPVDLRAKVFGATVTGARAAVKVSTVAGIGRLQLVREHGSWKIAPPGRTIVEYWRRLVYRIEGPSSGRVTPAVLAAVLAARANAMLGRRAFARALDRDRVVLGSARGRGGWRQEPRVPAARRSGMRWRWRRVTQGRT